MYYFLRTVFVSRNGRNEYNGHYGLSVFLCILCGRYVKPLFPLRETD